MMFQKFRLICKNVYEQFLVSFKRFTETLLLAASAVVIFIGLNHTGFMDKDTRDILTRIAMTLALGVPLSLSLQVFFERLPSIKNIVKISCKAIALTGLVLYYFFLLKDLNMVSSTRYFAVSISLYLIFLFVPYFLKREHYELYIVKLFTGFTVTYLYSLILYLGLAAIIFTLDKLFSVGTYHLYFDFWLIVAGVFAPAYFLSGIPAPGQTLPADYYPKVLKVLLLYIVMPIIAVYTAILYIYFAKIIITWVWPAGIVSHLVLWYSIIGVSVMFFIYPQKNSTPWCDKFIVFFPRLDLPLLAMMFLSLGIRTRAYGITENRYFVIIVGLWITGWMVYDLFSKKPRNILLPVTFALVAFLSVTGPWSCYTISKLSQSNRLAAILQKYDMLKDGVIIKPTQELPQSAQREISSILSYFHQNHQLSDIRYLPRQFKIKNMPSVFGFQFTNGYGRYNESSYFNYSFTGSKVQNIRDFDYFTELSKRYGETEHAEKVVIFQEKDLLFSYDRDYTFHITEHGKAIYTENISFLIAKLLEKYKDNLKSMKKLTYLQKTDRVTVLYVLDNIRGFIDETGKYKLDYFNCYVFLQFNTN